MLKRLGTHEHRKRGEGGVNMEVKYHYCVNTFMDNEPIQLEGDVYAESEADAIQKLIYHNLIDPFGYEFLELKAVIK